MSDALEKVLRALIWAAVGMVVLPSVVVMFLSFAETYLKVEFKYRVGSGYNSRLDNVVNL